jgi:hypothetical protein
MCPPSDADTTRVEQQAHDGPPDNSLLGAQFEGLSPCAKKRL